MAALPYPASTIAKNLSCRDCIHCGVNDYCDVQGFYISTEAWNLDCFTPEPEEIEEAA